MNIKARLLEGEQKTERWVETKEMEERIEGICGGKGNRYYVRKDRKKGRSAVIGK